MSIYPQLGPVLVMVFSHKVLISQTFTAWWEKLKETLFGPQDHLAVPKTPSVLITLGNGVSHSNILYLLELSCVFHIPSHLLYEFIGCRNFAVNSSATNPSRIKLFAMLLEWKLWICFHRAIQFYSHIEY